MSEHRSAAPTVPRWGLGAAVVGWVAGVVFGSVVFGVWVAATGQDTASLGARSAGQVGFWVGLLGAVVVTSRRGGTGNLTRDLGVRFRAADAPIGIVAGVVAQFVVFLLYVPFHSFFDEGDLERPARELADKAHGVAFLVFAIVIAVGAPLVEELFYRGLFLRSLQRYMADGPAVAVSALVFGAVHLQLLQLPALVLVGVLFAVLAVRTGRLGPAIWAHVAFNATTMVALALERR